MSYNLKIQNEMKKGDQFNYQLPLMSQDQKINS